MRKSDISNLLFPVELRPVYVKNPKTNTDIKISTSLAVVNTKSNEILGIVSKEYQLITNEEALKLGKQCCMEIFGLNSENDMEIFNVYAPSTNSYCHVDLIHSGYEMNLCDVTSKPEIYLPYVRITNSYNTTRALRFDVGFCRKLCLNGTIFESETIRFRYSHSKHEIGKSIQFEVKKNKLNELIDSFKDSMQRLKEFSVPIEFGKLIFSYVFGVLDKKKYTTKANFKESEYQVLKSYIQNLFNKYYSEFGSNAYALFNVFTDIASNPPPNRYFLRDINSMQRITGAWVNNFKQKIEESDFNFDNYIKELSEKYQGKSKTNPFN